MRAIGCHRRFLIISIILTGLVIVACLLSERYSRTALDSEIKFSYESGFYDNPIEVELSVGSNYYITYTLDGRAPNAACTRYEGPILINDASDNENVWAAMMETSLRYYEGPAYKVPEHKVDKCTILRAAAFDYSGNQVSSDVREYFINFGEKRGYKGMYNLCVATDPENLFSDETGIYSLGEFWRGKIESCKIYDMYVPGVGWDGCNRKANWNRSGRYTERPVTIELFDFNGQLITREACGMRVSGGDSRHDVQKPLKFFARKEYSGEDKFTYDFFGEGEGPQTFLMHSVGNDCDIKMIDYVVYSALKKGKNGFKITPIIPCNLFLEGEYWGPMFIEKTVSCETIADNFGVSEENIILIKSEEVKLDDEFEALKDKELNSWRELQTYIKDNDMSSSDNYEYVCSKLDVEDFAEYAATEIYIGNADWHRDNNYACWRTTRSEKDNPYSDGKWRFSLFDVNWSFESDDVIWGETYADWDFYYMVKCLCKNDDFKKRYLRNIEELKILFAPDEVDSIIAEWSSIMEEPIRCNFKRFTIYGDADERMAERKKQIIDFCKNRPTDIERINNWLFE